MNVLWSVPRHRRLNPLRARLRSLIVVTTLGAGAVSTTALSGLFAAGGQFGKDLGPGGTVLTLTLALLGNCGVFLTGFRLLTIRTVSWRALVPGALTAALLWQLLQAAGTFLLGHSFRHASQVYGLFGLVIGLLGWLYLAALITLLCAEANVVRERQFWPRALLTPFTDQVHLTSADQRSYTDLATTQQIKGFEHINVTFEEP
jgi:membrane protein